VTSIIIEILLFSYIPSAKIVVNLSKASPSKPQGPAVLEKAGYIKLSFRKKGQPEVVKL